MARGAAGTVAAAMIWVHRILLASLLVGAATLVPAGLRFGEERADLARAADELRALQADNAALRAEIQALEAEVRALQHEPREIERIARQDLHLVRPGEVVFRLPPPAHEEAP